MNNKGSTLVEVTVGFLMLAIILTSFIKIIDLSSELTEKAVNTKKNNLFFEEKYYEGYNYPTGNDNKMAFREDFDLRTSDNKLVVIQLKELKKNGDFFDQLKLGKIGTFESTDKYISVLTLSNIHIKVIENVRDMNMARKKIYRYIYS